MSGSHPCNIAWDGEVPGVLKLLDQTRLPQDLTYLEITSIERLRAAILALSVRGAPAIGVAAAYGAVLCAQAHLEEEDFAGRLEAELLALSETRPTAVNLAWAVDRARQVVLDHSRSAPGKIAQALLALARRIHAEEEETCRLIGVHGASLLPDRSTLLTHCNAGYLATGGLGTALAVAYTAHRQGKDISIYANETRPLWQGIRLTAWELDRDGIPVTVLCDGAAGALLATGRVDAVIVGADRVAANGDFANKIGTYPLAVLAARHEVPFYMAAPLSTFDPQLEEGGGIPIEQRPEAEVLCPGGTLVAPSGVRAWNPAFDITPAALVTAMITEKGVLRPPYGPAIAALLGARERSRS